MSNVSSDGLELSFEARGTSGHVNVIVAENSDPASLDTDLSALGFPVCRASVDFGLNGYGGFLGWIQLVGVRDSESADRIFETDPLQVFDQVDIPFAFYGLRPELFDAPSRSNRDQRLDWLAHSFLCVAPTHPMTKEVQAVVGFSWGFVIAEGEVSIVGPEKLDLTEWTRHTALLNSVYPSWNFIA
jgi:hypothetical protein